MADRAGTRGPNDGTQRHGAGTSPPDATTTPEPSPPGGSGVTYRARPSAHPGKGASGRVPVLTQALLRNWALDDERVVSALAHENQAGRHRRTNAVGDRAKDAGWPVPGFNHQRKAATDAMHRLEPITYSTIEGHRPRTRISYHRASRGTDEAGGTINQVITIFDE